VKLIKRNCEYFIDDGEKGGVRVPFFKDSDLEGIPLDQELSSKTFLRVLKISVERWEAKRGDATFKEVHLANN
jgi:hypothetical protein